MAGLPSSSSSTTTPQLPETPMSGASTSTPMSTPVKEHLKSSTVGTAASVSAAGTAVKSDAELGEEHDAFHMESLSSPAGIVGSSQPPVSRAFHRPIPLHYHSLSSPTTAAVGGSPRSSPVIPHHHLHIHSAKCSSPTAILHPHHHPRLQAVLNNPFPFPPSASASPSSLPPTTVSPSGGQQQQPASLQPDLSDSSGHLRKSSAAAAAAANAMSRSISDSTLRQKRAALHLNLNQSVLPSFTSLQQFKVRDPPLFQATVRVF